MAQERDVCVQVPIYLIRAIQTRATLMGKHDKDIYAEALKEYCILHPVRSLYATTILSAITTEDNGTSTRLDRIRKTDEDIAFERDCDELYNRRKASIGHTPSGRKIEKSRCSNRPVQTLAPVQKVSRLHTIRRTK